MNETHRRLFRRGAVSVAVAAVAAAVWIPTVAQAAGGVNSSGVSRQLCKRRVTQDRLL